MKRKLSILLCAVVLCVTAVFAAGCDKTEPLSIVYLGDSIAEAVLGPSPLADRESYGYYALLGRCNEFNYYNRSVSGHKSAQLLQLINTPDSGASMTQTHIKDADIIHISILGNDILQDDVATMLIEAADDNYDTVDAILNKSRVTFAAIVNALKALNPDAKIIFQTIYNPADNNSSMIKPEAAEYLLANGYTPDDYRAVADKLMKRLNQVIWDYYNENPDSIYVADAYTAFDNIYKQSRERGNRLIFTDWVHPSNEGHALAALVTQNLFEELGVANKNFLKNYKKLRTEQVERLYGDTDVNVSKVKRAIRKADSYQAVSDAYFDAVLGVVPKY